MIIERRHYCDEDCPGDETCDNVNWCCCGDHVDHHGMGSGHSPVSMHYYYGGPGSWWRDLWNTIKELW